MNEALSREQVEALLGLLSSDDQYRELFQRDLETALARLPGAPAVPSGATPGSCLRPARLASKETLTRSREQLVGDYLAFGTLIPKILEA